MSIGTLNIPTIPEVLTDGNTVAWYDYNEGITKTDASVSVWADKSGKGRNLLQAVGAAQPSWSSDGILFDGVDDFLKTNTFTFNQPCHIYIVAKHITWTSGDRIIEGFTSNTIRITQSAPQPSIVAYSGNSSATYSNLVLNSWHILKVLFNGVNSKLQIDNSTAIVGDFGSLNPDGLCLAAKPTGSGFANIQVKEIILRNVADSGRNEESIYSYLRNKYFGETLTINPNNYILTIPSWEPEADLYFARMTVQPNYKFKWYINNLIKALKVADIWDHLDVLRLANIHTEQASLLNVKTVDFGNATNVNSLSWLTRKGFYGTGAVDAKYLLSGFNPSINATNYTQNNAFYGIYTSGDEVIIGYNAYGIYLSGTTYCSPKGGAGTSYRARCYTNNTSIPNQAVPVSSTGLTISSRVVSTHCQWFKNGIIQDTDADTSTPISNAEFREVGGGSISYPGYVNTTIYGGGISTAQQLSLYNILSYFNNNIAYI